MIKRGSPTGLTPLRCRPWRGVLPLLLTLAAVPACVSSTGSEQTVDVDQSPQPTASVTTVAGVGDFNSARDNAEGNETTTIGAAPPTSESVEASTSSSTSEPTTSTSTTEGEADGGIEQWLGTYRWSEFVESDVGSDQTWSHEFRFTEIDESALFGTYTLTGFQVDVETLVRAEFNQGGDILVRHVATVKGQPNFQENDVLVIFHGDPGDFVTTLNLITNLVPSIAAQGTYFEHT